MDRDSNKPGKNEKSCKFLQDLINNLIELEIILWQSQRDIPCSFARCFPVKYL